MEHRDIRDEIDLAAGGPHYKKQPRDNHGRWTDTGQRLTSAAKDTAKRMVRASLKDTLKGNDNDEAKEISRHKRLKAKEIATGAELRARAQSQIIKDMVGAVAAAKAKHGEGSPEHRLAQRRAKEVLAKQATKDHASVREGAKLSDEIGTKVKEAAPVIRAVRVTKPAPKPGTPEFKALADRLNAIYDDDSIMEKYSTDKIYKKPDGSWEFSRAVLHKRIVNDLLADAAEKGVKKNRKALMTGGLAGAGKGGIQREVLENPDGYLVLDPDEIKARMIALGMTPGVPGLTAQEQATYIHEESSHISKMLRAEALAHGVNVIADRSMGGASTKTEVKLLREQGYDVQAFFSEVSPETSKVRAAQRYVAQHNDGTGRGGRFVPDWFIDSAVEDGPYGTKNRRIFEEMIREGLLSSWMLYDNNGKAPRRVKSGGKPWDGKP